MAYIIYDLAILAFLIYFFFRGARRGLVLSLLGLVAVLVAFAGARFVSDFFSPRVADALEPRLAAAIQETLEDRLQAEAANPETPNPESVEELPFSDLLDSLKDMGGFYRAAAEDLENAMEKGLTDVAARTAASLAATVAEQVARTLLFSVAFTVILVLWALLSRALDLVAKLPGLNGLNRAGGALFGLLKGCAFLFLGAWVLRYLGNIIPPEAVEQTRLLRFFMTTNPLSLLLAIKA